MEEVCTLGTSALSTIHAHCRVALSSGRGERAKEPVLAGCDTWLAAGLVAPHDLSWPLRRVPLAITLARIHAVAAWVDARRRVLAVALAGQQVADEEPLPAVLGTASSPPPPQATAAPPAA